MGFRRQWIDIILQCVSTVSYSIIINGSSYGIIHPTRVLREGDPLSLYLFLICAEGLLPLLSKALNRNLIHGVAASKRGPKLSHLFFADDRTIFW